MLLLVGISRLAAEVVGDLRLNDEPLLAEVFGCIEDRYQDPVSLKDVARAVSLTPGHLTTVVRRKTGRTVQEWIAERRLAEARHLLVRDRPGCGGDRAQGRLQRSRLLRENLQARPRHDTAGLAARQPPVKGNPPYPRKEGGAKLGREEEATLYARGRWRGWRRPGLGRERASRTGDGGETPAGAG